MTRLDEIRARVEKLLKSLRPGEIIGGVEVEPVIRDLLSRIAGQLDSAAGRSRAQAGRADIFPCTQSPTGGGRRSPMSNILNKLGAFCPE